jgi:hypothetical protein
MDEAKKGACRDLQVWTERCIHMRRLCLSRWRKTLLCRLERAYADYRTPRRKTPNGSSGLQVTVHRCGSVMAFVPLVSFIIQLHTALYCLSSSTPEQTLSNPITKLFADLENTFTCALGRKPIWRRLKSRGSVKSRTHPEYDWSLC